MSQSKKILFIMTGSIASYKACGVISRLKQNGHNLKVVMSPSSLNYGYVRRWPGNGSHSFSTLG
jgi:phosphopantothenoylcysteine synthetase/decarboxylase